MSEDLKSLTDGQIQGEYVKAGTAFGEAVSYLYLGECIGFQELLDAWQKYETEYAARGYRALSVDAFINAGGYDVPLEGIGQKREEGEDGVSHAQIYRETYLGKTAPAIDINQMMETGEPQFGRYALPSTEEKK